MNIKACSERIIWEISKAIDHEYKVQLCDADMFGDPDEIDDHLLECKELCDKLLTHDYFAESEEILNSVFSSKSEIEIDKLEAIRKKWVKMYGDELKVKKKDMKRLFNLIADYSEDWC